MSNKSNKQQPTATFPALDTPVLPGVIFPAVGTETSSCLACSSPAVAGYPLCSECWAMLPRLVQKALYREKSRDGRMPTEGRVVDSVVRQAREVRARRAK